MRLADYLSYDEMQISALIGISSEVMFINQGERKNQGELRKAGSYEREGVYVGLVGCRFERPELMEYQHVIISKDNNNAKGYGLKGDDNKERDKLRIWAQFYDQRLKNGEFGFADFSEANEEQESGSNRLKRYNTHNGEKLYFNIDIFKHRLAITIETFLYEAEFRAQKADKMAYVHAVGLGMGAWQVTTDQEAWLLDVFAEVIMGNPFRCIADINFSWWRERTCGKAKSGDKIRTSAGHDINVIFSKRNPAEKLTGKDSNKMLVCCYAWDSNALPGNEYWCGLLDASGDPAAASCSTIPEMHNPYINPCISIVDCIFIVDPEVERNKAGKEGTTTENKQKKNLKGNVVIEKEKEEKEEKEETEEKEEKENKEEEKEKEKIRKVSQNIKPEESTKTSSPRSKSPSSSKKKKKKL